MRTLEKKRYFGQCEIILELVPVPLCVSIGNGSDVPGRQLGTSKS